MNFFKKDKYKGSSEHLQNDLDLNKIINKRLILLMMAMALVATSLIGRLYYVQIVNHDYYTDLVASKELAPMSIGTARGEIYDRNGQLLVTNKPINTINFYTNYSISTQTQWDLAYKFAQRYEVDFDLMPRELKDLYLFLNDYGADLVTNDEMKALDYDDDAIDKLKLERVSDELIETLTDLEKEAFKIYLKMNNQTQRNAAVILENASDEDISYLSENQYDFPGFTWGTTWERDYVGPDGLQSLIGNIQDIPVEKLSYMSAKGYSNNDKIGVSGLEYQYEEYLSGVKSEYRTDATTGESIQTVAGRKGHDLFLTIDLKLQEQVEKVVKDQWNAIKNQPRREYMHGIDFVLSDPQTGDILSIVGLRETSKGEIYNDPSTVLLEAFPVGSVVKGATVYAGLQEGVVKPNEAINDSPLYIAGTQPRVSWTNLGSVTDLTALQRSSNIYMFIVAIRMGGASYIPNEPLIFSKPIENTFALLRNYFGQFGLGVETMIDFPREELGYKGANQQAGLLLNFAVGQYDNYNAMQLNQYISTVGNEGYRLQPHLVKEIRNSIDNTIILKNDPVILNEIDGKNNLERVREGFRLCNERGDCGNYATKSYTSAGKTGTAEYTDNGGKNMINNAFILFAPFEKPKIATSCIHSGAYYGNDYPNICKDITPKVVDIYMNSN